MNDDLSLGLLTDVTVKVEPLGKQMSRECLQRHLVRSWPCTQADLVEKAYVHKMMFEEAMENVRPNHARRAISI